MEVFPGGFGSSSCGGSGDNDMGAGWRVGEYGWRILLVDDDEGDSAGGVAIMGLLFGIEN